MARAVDPRSLRAHPHIIRRTLPPFAQLSLVSSQGLGERHCRVVAISEIDFERIWWVMNGYKFQLN